MKDPLNVLVVGVGGQGNLLASLLIGSAATEEGFYVSVGETYGATQRGGPVMSHLRLSKRRAYSPLMPEGVGDILLGFEPVETLRALGTYGNPNIKVMVNPRPVYPLEVLSGQTKYPEVGKVLEAIRELSGEVVVVEATELAKRAGDARMQNVVMVGCLATSGWLPLRPESFRKVVVELFGENSPNLRALELGMAEGKK
ncbi:MAG: indolepyruvate ferredoxin oxidoreductase [Hadesarchaea archaeon]|nr:MAG: indolepyruvate ferredoxin oxidoreductase [Hadesarchaea archaeon]TDA36626.1 MAG: indolepyruvate ferredoxin oxidoreductase [Hadesarchaea archaeon]